MSRFITVPHILNVTFVTSALNGSKSKYAPENMSYSGVGYWMNY